jgi:hypothetical protein
MTTTELSFVEEDIPTIVRTGGSGAQPIKWEDLLAPLMAEDKAGKSFRVWEYEKKTGATSRVATVRARLTEVVPEQNWKIAVRPVPGSDPVKHGVYVQFDGMFTPEQVAARAKDREARIAKIKAARKAAESADATLAGGSPDTDNASSPAEKVAAAKKAQASKSVAK